jgi:hypothetical protein
VNHSGNLVLATQAAQKIKENLQIQSEMEPRTFLMVLLSDYNYVSSRE